MNHIHIVNTDKFVEPFIKFVNLNFNLNEHKFLTITSAAKNHIKDKYSNVYVHKKVLCNIKLLKEINRADHIYLHGLFEMRILLLLFLQPWILKKCFWIVWGGDLYAYRKSQSSFKRAIKEMFRNFVIKRLGHIITLVKGDFYLAKDWYGIKGKYHHGAYVSPISKKYLDSMPFIKKEINDPVIIQIGNSADPTNNHIEALQSLKEYKDKNINIYAPLSYGNKEYANLVIEEGNKLFGDKFIPLTEFLSPLEYSKYLNSVDIAIFNNDRQQALGNIYALLYLNKKVYIRSDTTMFKHFIDEFDIKLCNVLQIKNLEFEEFIKMEPPKNKSKISLVFEESYLKGIWDKNFNIR